MAEWGQGDPKDLRDTYPETQRRPMGLGWGFPRDLGDTYGGPHGPWTGGRKGEWGAEKQLPREALP